MISPKTATGTRIVFIDSFLRPEFLSPYGMKIFAHLVGTCTLSPSLWQPCTLRAIKKSRYAKCGFVCQINESESRRATYPLEAFAYLELPRSITSLLDVAPIDASKEMEPV